MDPKLHIISLQIIEEQKDTRKQLSQEWNARMLQDEILANHLAKRKETEMANKEMNSEVVFSVVIFKYVYMSLCMYIFKKPTLYIIESIEDFENLYIYILRRETFSICWIK